MAQIALLLCTAFVLFLLRVERRASPRISAASWIPTLWMLLLTIKPMGYWFSMRADLEDGNPLDRILLTALAIAGMVVVARRRFGWQGALRRHGWLLVLLGYMLVSTFWSDIMLVALKRWIREVLVLIMAMVTISEDDPQRTLESVLRRCTYMTIPFSIVLIKYYPALGVSYSPWTGVQTWSGVASEKNGLGRLCFVSGFLLIWSLYRYWRGRRAPRSGRQQAWADFSVLPLVLFLLGGAQKGSATAIATFGVGMASFLTLVCFRKLRLGVPRFALLGIVLLVIGFGASAPFLGGSNVAIFSSSLGRSETLTDRTEIWAALVPLVSRNPILGVGFESFWTTAQRAAVGGMPHGHNGYLDILLSLGGVGLAIFVVWLLSCTKKFHRALAENYDWASFGIGCLVMVLVYNTTESALDSLVTQTSAVLTLASFVVLHRAESDPRRHNAVHGGTHTAAIRPGMAVRYHSAETAAEYGDQISRQELPRMLRQANIK